MKHRSQSKKNNGPWYKGSWGNIIIDFLALTKAEIVILLLITTFSSMVLASSGLPDLMLAIAVCLSGALAAGGSGAINQYADREVDALMARTRRRPLTVGRIAPGTALGLGIGFNVVAFTILMFLVNFLSAMLVLAGSLFYIIVYTLWLKKVTPENIVIGGAAGAVAPLVGWTAVTGSVDWPAVYMFGIVFLWTPPHFWALALLLKQDYAKANIPMLPVVVGVAKTNQRILIYSIILATFTMCFPFIISLSWIYISVSFLLNILLIYACVKLFRGPVPPAARHLFQYSLIYLSCLFVTLAVEGAI